MTQEQLLKNLQVPTGPIDVILDTDTYNEIDDQFALAYMLSYPERLRVKGICAAPFFNANSSSPADGMQKSYEEILKLLKFAGKENLNNIVYKGSECWLPDETTPVISDAAKFMADLADKYTPENPLYIVAIGAITNVASALLLNPSMKDNIVLVWLGGNAHHVNNSKEFNMMQDVAAARIVFGCGTPLVQLPCVGVVSSFSTSRYELEHWLIGKNPLSTYLAENTIQEAETYAKGTAWTRIIWDVTAVAWLLNDNDRFMQSSLVHTPIPEYDHHYGFDNSRQFMRYVTYINRDALFTDLFERLTR